MHLCIALLRIEKCFSASSIPHIAYCVLTDDLHSHKQVIPSLHLPWTCDLAALTAAATCHSQAAHFNSYNLHEEDSSTPIYP
jgi:hypothetical protein